MEHILAVASIILGFIGLIWSADKFVLGASTTARNLGVSPLVIGLTIVALGTSAPEIFTSAAASLKGVPELAIGNALGSNIANIGLVLGFTALVCPLVIPVTLLKQELPALLIVTFATYAIFYDLRLNQVDGLIMLGLLGLFSWRMFASKNSQPTQDINSDEDIAEFVSDISTSKALALMLFGLILMVISSNILVSGATSIALSLGISELVVGLTIVAIGTSLPELAASVTSAFKGHHELAFGNIIGSNILNLLLVLPVPAFLSPMDISPLVISRDYTSMLFFTLLLVIAVVVLTKKKIKMGRFLGAVFLSLYIAYTGFLFLS